MNDGDWVESCTALVEHHNGKWEIITWTKENDSVDTDIDSGEYKQLKRHSGKNKSTVQGSADLRTNTGNNDLQIKV
jgi:hypothetical protein